MSTGNIKKTTNCESLCCYNGSLSKSSYQNEIHKLLKIIINKVFYQFEKRNIDKKKLIHNIIETSLHDFIADNFSPLAGLFNVLENSLNYYKDSKNEIMILLIDLSLMESNLLYFEDAFPIKIGDISKKENLYINSVIESNF